MHNGYKNWNHWNVALWLYNDEGLYNLMRDAMRHNSSIRDAADEILQSLHELGITCTPDGAKFSRAAVMAALRN